MMPDQWIVENGIFSIVENGKSNTKERRKGKIYFVWDGNGQGTCLLTKLQGKATLYMGLLLVHSPTNLVGEIA
jgi:hypothetical protein